MDVNIKVTLELPEELLELIRQAATSLIYWEDGDDDDEDSTGNGSET